PVCSEHPSQTELIDYDVFCGVAPEAVGEGVAAPGTAAANGRPAVGGGDGTGGGASGGEATLTAPELAARLDRGERPFLLDVREPHEWMLANLEPQGARHIPLSQLRDRIAEV